MSKKNILIFIVAYHHEKSIQAVLRRIPSDVFKHNTEVLIIDDASSDETFQKAEEFRSIAEQPFKLTVLYNPENLGYGGNQKVGFQYAIDKGFDVVALLHGDGQYAPERLPELLQPLLDSEADAVFGSRMMNRLDALKGGMPLYKYVGNKILTTFQNFALSTNLSEFHSGYRLYTVGALKKLPFHLNTNDFHFDTEIIIQLVFAGLKIKEIPIPTYYGDEICNVDGLKYAKDVFKVTSLAPFQRLGLLYQRKFDFSELEGEQRYASKVDFDSSHSLAIRQIPRGAKILDLGCSSGIIAAELKSRGCYVTGIDSVPTENRDAFDEYHVCDLDRDELPVDVTPFDYILLLDFIEHLAGPEAFVDRLYEKIGNNPQAKLIVTTGNIAFVVVRLVLMFGAFNYGRRGILDMDHKRLFTFSTIRSLFEERGFDLLEKSGIPAPFQLAFGRNTVSAALNKLNRMLLKVLPGLMSFQILCVFKPRPSLGHLLGQAIKTGNMKRAALNATKAS